MGRRPQDQYAGRQVDYDESHGPLRNRSCTDIICLLIFLAFIGAWVAIGVWAILHGNPDKLLVPTDSNGLHCGLDPEVEDRKYLFFFDLTKCLSPTSILGCDTTQVCVKECPQDIYVHGSYDDSLVYPYCNSYSSVLTSYDEAKCPQWFLPSQSIQRRCIPLSPNATSITEIVELLGINETTFLTDLKQFASQIQLVSDAEQFAQQVIADLVSSWWKILVSIGIALVACIIYILMLRWIAGVMVWISIAGAVAALAAGSYFSFDAWQNYKTQYAADLLDSTKRKRDLLLVSFIVVVSVLAIVLLVLLFLRKRISLAIALIKEGSRAVSSVTSVLFFPIVPWIMQVGVVAYTIVVAVYLATTGEPVYRYRNVTAECTEWQNNEVCDPNAWNSTTIPSGCENASCRFIGIANEAFYPYLQALNVFGFFWLAFFVSALGQMVLAQVFAQWYWTIQKSTLPFFALTAAFYRTIRYHLGTLAFGSLIIAICRMIRVCLEYIDHKLKKYDNAFTKAILCCLKCFFWCLEKFLKFINKNAYIMCAIHGKNFCASAKDAFMLLMRNIIRVFVLDKVTDFLFFLSKVLVTAGVGAVAYVFFATDMIDFVDNSELNFGLTPVVVIMIITYLIATLFFSVYSMAVDTLFLCFLEDCERNDGKSKPYFMSRNLMRIFGKKNKGPKYE